MNHIARIVAMFLIAQLICLAIELRLGLFETFPGAILLAIVND